MKTVFYITEDLGDGSSCVRFFHELENAEEYMDNNENSCYGNEGCVNSFMVTGNVIDINFKDFPGEV